MRRGQIMVTSVLLGVAAFGGVVIFANSAKRFEMPAPRLPDQLPDKAVIASVLTDAGISPEALAVAGLSGSEATPVIGAAVSAADFRLVPLRASYENKASTAREYTRMRREGSATPIQLASAREAMELAAATHRGLIAQVRSAAVNLLESDELRRLDAYAANSGRDLPLRFRAYAWKAKDAVDVMQALQQKTADETRGDAVDPAAQAIIDQADLNLDVAIAASTLDTRLAAIHAAWDGEVAGGE